MSKSKSPDDQNYIQVRNVLYTLVEEATSQPAAPKDSVSLANPQAADKLDTPAPTRRQLSQILSVHSHPKTDLDILQDRIMSGSCRWILDRETFQQWHDGINSSGCALLWLKGLPGVGKSILSSFVISTLSKDHPDIPCCYYFFSSRDQTKRSVKNMLTSIALQLGLLSRSFGEQLVKWEEDGNGPVDQLQAVNVWASIFQDLVFNSGTETPMFWVIDGLDEADDPKTLVQLFKKLEASHRLRIWIASRHIKEMTALRDFGAKVSWDEIKLDDTSHDIRTYADRAVGSILPDGALDVKDNICKTILEKAQGSFLWVSLAIDQLENKWHTPEAIREALEDLPDGMEGFYDRMMAAIANQPASRALACRILTWAMSSFRPLSLAELEVALAHEFPRLLDLKGTITQACASFVVVRSAHVAMLHDTARAFMLERDGAPPLSIDLREGEGYAAEMCLRYLIRQGNDLRRILSSAEPADRTGEGGVPPVFDKHPFLAYAVTWWAYHLGRAPQKQDLAALAHDFLCRFALVWIHAVALVGEVRILTRAAESLLVFLQQSDTPADEPGAAKRPKTQEPTPKALATLQESTAAELVAWATDLRRVAWRFGSELAKCPMSIYSTTVPFCPTESMIRRCFQTTGGLVVAGGTEEVWPEYIARLSIPHSKEERTSWVFCSGPYFVVSAASGSLIVYYAESCHEARRIHHGERLSAIASRKTSTRVATAGATAIRIWDLVTGEMVCFLPLPSEHNILAMEFGAEEKTLLIGCDDRSIHCVSLETLEKQWSHLFKAPDVFPATLPWSMFISPELGKVAAGYVPEPLVFVWRLDSPAKKPQEIRLEFKNWDLVPNHLRTQSPDEAIWQLGPPATLVFSRHLALFECNLEMGTSRSVSDPGFGWAAGLAGSSDGKFIAAQDGSRAEMCIVEEAPTYAPVARLSSHGLARAIAFSVNNQRLYISTGDFCNVWEPTVFLRAHAAHQTLARPARISQVTMLVASPDGRFYGVVRNSSAAELHDTTSGELVRQFLPHTQHYGWYNLAWSTSGRYVASVQGHGGEVVVEDLGSPILSDETSQAIVGQFPSPGIGLQLLFDPSDRSLLVFRASLETHGRATPVLLDPRRGNLLATGAEQDVSRGSGLWLSHPTDDTLLLHVDIWGARAFKVGLAL